jgi:16S rRNA processing protein RimM
LEIACPTSSETLLLPFTKEVFPRVDIEAGHLTVVPPLEVDAKPPSPKD